MKIQTATVTPPATRKAPENAQVRFVNISFGVISLWHCGGLAPSGITKASAISKIPMTRHVLR